MKKRRLFLITVVLTAFLVTCAFAADISADMANGAVMANNNLVITAVAHSSQLDEASIAATQNATTGTTVGLEANILQNTANTGANNTLVAGTALVNEGTINAGANNANIAGVRNELDHAMNAAAASTAINGAPRKAPNQVATNSAAGKVVRTG